MRGPRRVALALLVAGGALGLAGCSDYSGSATQRVGEWANGASYSADNAQIEQDLSDLNRGYATRQLLALRTACAGFGGDIEALLETLPTPDRTLTNELNDALGDFSTAATDCYDAPSFSSARFHAYLAELTKARAVYSAAQSRLRHFGVG